MSGTDYTQTPNLGLYKPVSNRDVGMWGTHWNLNADTLDTVLAHGAYLPLAGGTLTGSLYITPPTITSTATVPALQTTWTVNSIGGSNLDIRAQTNNITNITNAVGQAIWANRDQLTYSSPIPSTTGTSYIGRAINTVATTNRGTAVGAPQMWGAIIDIVDETGHNSSIAGQLLGLEIDIEAGGQDDAGVRQGLVIGAGTRNYPTVPTSEFDQALAIVTGDNGASFKKLIAFGAPFSFAGIDFSGATAIGGAPAILLQTGQAISFDSNKNSGLRWSIPDTLLEFQWQGARILSLSPAGDMVVSGSTTLTGGIAGTLRANNIQIAQGNYLSFDTSQDMRILWSNTDGSLDWQWTGRRVFSIDPSGSVILNGNLSVGGAAVQTNLIAAASDAAAAAAGVQINGLYNNAGVVHVRLT